ncbi:MAG TPA: CsgG/HfaB family protein, partial [Blastocatellia bacterium]|nr:CsgG/HfaB family protein [Blastocatellia bacterium]
HLLPERWRLHDRRFVHSTPHSEVLFMRKFNFSLIILLSLGLCAALSANAQNAEHRPVIGVTTLENPPNYLYSTVGSGLTDLLVTELMKTDRYKIIERGDLDDLVDEVELGRSGYVDRQSSVKKGYFQGLEYLVIGKVTNFGERERSIGYLVGYRSREAYVRIDFRIVDATTGEIVYSGFGEGKDTTRGAGFAAFYSSAPVAVDVASASFLTSQIGRATIKAIDQAAAKLDDTHLDSRVSGAQVLAQQSEEAKRQAEEIKEKVPGRILAVAGDQSIIVNLGSSHGFKPGDRLQVFRVERVLDSKGVPVFTEERAAGVISLRDVQLDRSKAEKVSGEEFKEGYIVRRM